MDITLGRRNKMFQINNFLNIVSFSKSNPTIDKYNRKTHFSSLPFSECINQGFICGLPAP